VREADGGVEERLLSNSGAEGTELAHAAVARAVGLRAEVVGDRARVRLPQLRARDRLLLLTPKDGAGDLDGRIVSRREDEGEAVKLELDPVAGEEGAQRELDAHAPHVRRKHLDGKRVVAREEGGVQPDILELDEARAEVDAADRVVRVDRNEHLMQPLLD